jgi:aminoglycoside phosphotransferase
MACQLEREIKNPNYDLDIYANYIEKLDNRYNSYDYSKFKDSDFVYKKLRDVFEKFKSENMATHTIIHGDPVFTNILIDKNNKIKFIDMRGEIGDTLTIEGDMFYDYGKIYQSLIGYEEVHQSTHISNMYKNNILKYYENYLIEKFDHETLIYVRAIAYSLLFTLIPLHDNDKCNDYYKLINLDNLKKID